MDNLPTARNYLARRSVNGVVTSVQIGGSTGERLATLSIHGSVAGNMPLLFGRCAPYARWRRLPRQHERVINNGMVQETTVAPRA